MDNQPYKIIISSLSKFFEDNGFKYKHGDTPIYVNDDYAVGVVYEEASRMYNLLLADIDENGEMSEFKIVSSWLFDEGHTEKHAKDIGVDFLDELKRSLGIKDTRGISAENVALPKKVKQHDKPTIESLANIIIDMFPEFKDVYKENVAKYGEFMYELFFSKTVAPVLIDLINANDTKKLTKFINTLNHYYCNGNGELSSIITYSIIGTAFTRKNDKNRIEIDTAAWETAKTFFGENNFLLEASEAMLKHMVDSSKSSGIKFWKKNKTI